MCDIDLLKPFDGTSIDAIRFGFTKKNYDESKDEVLRWINIIISQKSPFKKTILFQCFYRILRTSRCICIVPYFKAEKNLSDPNKSAIGPVFYRLNKLKASLSAIMVTFGCP